MLSAFPKGRALVKVLAAPLWGVSLLRKGENARRIPLAAGRCGPFTTSRSHVAELRRPGGHRNREHATAQRNPPTPGRISGDIRQYGRRRSDVRLRASPRRVEPQLQQCSTSGRLLDERRGSPSISTISPNAVSTAPASWRRGCATDLEEIGRRSCASSASGPTGGSSRYAETQCRTVASF